MLAIAGGKGGSGKTTTTLGLATALPEETVAVDLDRDMPNLHALAGLSADEALDPNEAERSPGSDHPSAVGVSILPPVDRAADVTALLNRLSTAQEAVLLDCPAGAGPDAATPLRAADAVLLVSTLCAPALRDTAKTAAMARELGTPVAGAVLTRTRQTPTAVERLLGCSVLTSVPAAPSPVLDADVVRAAYMRLADVVHAEGLL